MPAEPLRSLPPSRFVDVEGPVHYREWPGPGRDLTIVCVHALGENHLSWLHPAPHLAAVGRVVALDLPGYGLSPRHGRRGTVEGHQRALAGFIRAVAPASKVVLFAESMGGAVSVMQATREPAAVAGVALISSFLPPVLGGWRAPLVVTGLLLQRVGDIGFGIQRAVLPDDDGDPFEQAAREDLQRRRPADQNRALTDTEGVVSLIALSLGDHARRLFDEVACPVLVVHGSLDREVPVQWARALHRRHPEWQLHVLEEVGHIFELDDPGWWVPIAQDWLHHTVT